MKICASFLKKKIKYSILWSYLVANCVFLIDHEKLNFCLLALKHNLHKITNAPL